MNVHVINKKELKSNLTFNEYIAKILILLSKNIYYELIGTCLLSKLSIPRLHDEDVSTIATHPTKKKKK